MIETRRLKNVVIFIHTTLWSLILLILYIVILLLYHQYYYYKIPRLCIAIVLLLHYFTIYYPLSITGTKTIAIITKTVIQELLYYLRHSVICQNYA